MDLAAARGACLDFLCGENDNTDSLRDELGGVAGLTRFWSYSSEVGVSDE